MPYCTISIKGTKVQVASNKCGEFTLETDKLEFTILFNCFSTHDFRTFEKQINSADFHKGAEVLFKLKNHRRLINKECNSKISKRLRKIVIH